MATSSGLKMQVDIREDEEQATKFEEIIDLLLAAGYFRARIKGLTPFDKVVGGMTWCIDTCNYDHDIDFDVHLFQENLTIGQKISLTEQIVVVLPKMKCPHRLEPHQIQGLDFIHIFPIVQWLVKKAIETREKRGDYVRAYSISQFQKYYRTPEDELAEEAKDKTRCAISIVLDSYHPKRRYRRHDAHKLKEEEIRVESTLLEYGRQYGMVNLPQSVKGDNIQQQQQSIDSDSKERIAEENRISTLMSSMSATAEHEKLTLSMVGSIVGLRSSEIEQMASIYANKQTESMSQDERGQLHSRTVANIKKQIGQKRATLSEMEQQKESLQTRCQQLQQQILDVEERNSVMQAEMKQFESMETDENQGVLQKLRSLIAMNENLKKQEREFRNHCKEELARLNAKTEELQSSNSVDESDDKEFGAAVDKQYKQDKEKLQKLRLLLAKKNREVAILQRKIDEVPTRAELSQYQQRFVELYNFVAAKHKETKQFYTLYNTLDDTKLYLAKEVTLLNSILDNFTEAMGSSHSKDQFLKQFEQIVEGTNQNKIKLEKRKQEEKMRRDQLNDTYLNLVEQQRHYFKTVKEFKEECRKNEIMLAKLKGMGQ